MRASIAATLSAAIGSPREFRMATPTAQDPDTIMPWFMANPSLRVRSTNRAMPPYSDKILTDGDLEDIYAYLQTIPKPPDAKTIPLLNP